MSGSARHDGLPSGVEADARPLSGWPSHPNRLVGREKDLEALHVLLLRGTVRLVTVTGPPGVGKTRCAIELAAAITPEFDAGAVFVDLAPVRDAGMVADAIARALGVADHPDRPALRRLQDHLSDRNVLLLLDNFEHVIAAAGAVADLLAACPHVKVLVTSRQPLHIRWEHRYNLSPLALPDETARSDRAALTRAPAAALFIERARASDARFSVDERAAPIVAEICGRLDGLPLAIELAAAWSGALGLDAIRSRLSNAQALPLSGPRDVPERQRTLVDAIAWSYDLLNEAERRVFRALGAFAGEIPPDAIEAVCEGLRVDILTPVAGLVDKNLLTRVEDGETRFRMLETIREFADERLELTGEADGVRRRHASWFLALAQRAERFIWSEHQAAWFERLERAHDNIRAALHWCLSGGDEETGVLLTAAMHRFWFAHGYIRDGLRWCRIAASKQRVSATGRALALRNLAFFLHHQGEREQALELAEQAAALARSVGDPSLMIWVLLGLGQAMQVSGDLERSERVYGEMLEIARRAGDDTQVARALNNIGTLLLIRGDKERGRRLLEEALAIARPRHDKWLTSLVTGSLGQALAPEDPGQGLKLLEESLALSHEIGHRWLTVRGLEELAGMLAPTDRAEVAAELLGATESLRDVFGFRPGPGSEARVNATAASARDRLRSAAFDAAWSKGKRMTADEAVALALGRNVPARSEPLQRPGGLTGREVQIVLAIARGLTNRQIAEKLEISERTVDAHMQNVRNKLGMERRAQIAAWASAHLPESASP
ncbi:MAG TPA: LuxR C-terminal-related transcriptional regulator [bacterium]